MNDRFSSTGVNAGTAKRRHVLRIADAPATSPISVMYGNMIRVSSTAMSKPSSTRPVAVGTPQRSFFRPPASSHTTTGVPTMPTTVDRDQRPGQHRRDVVDEQPRLVARNAAP